MTTVTTDIVASPIAVCKSPRLYTAVANGDKFVISIEDELKKDYRFPLRDSVVPDGCAILPGRERYLPQNCSICLEHSKAFDREGVCENCRSNWRRLQLYQTCYKRNWFNEKGVAVCTFDGIGTSCRLDRSDIGAFMGDHHFLCRRRECQQSVMLFMTNKLMKTTQCHSNKHFVSRPDTWETIAELFEHIELEIGDNPLTAVLANVGNFMTHAASENSPQVPYQMPSSKVLDWRSFAGVPQADRTISNSVIDELLASADRLEIDPTVLAEAKEALEEELHGSH